jgi:hypothetical protein
MLPSFSSGPWSHALTVWDSAKQRTRDVMVDEMPDRASVDFGEQPKVPECRPKRVYADHADPVMATNPAPARETPQEMASPFRAYACGRQVPQYWWPFAFSAS